MSRYQVPSSSTAVTASDIPTASSIAPTTTEFGTSAATLPSTLVTQSVASSAFDTTDNVESSSQAPLQRMGSDTSISIKPHRHLHQHHHHHHMHHHNKETHKHNLRTSFESTPGSVLSSKMRHLHWEHRLKTEPTPPITGKRPQWKNDQIYDHDDVSLKSATSRMQTDTKAGTNDLVPPVVSQTGLMQSIGRPFNPNPNKFIAITGPGNEYMLTRRASEVRLKQLPLISNLSIDVLTRYERILTWFAGIILGVGIAGFILLVCSASIATPMEYIFYFLTENVIFLIIFILSAVQPFVVAPLCKYALINLKHIRSYYIRVPASLVLPLTVALCSLVLIGESGSEKGGMYTFLQLRMKQYYSQKSLVHKRAAEVWEGIHSTFKCCGYNGFKDWLKVNNTHLPMSCCKLKTKDCGQNNSKLFKKGCVDSYRSLNVTISVLFFLFSVAIIILEILSIIWMRRLWRYIRKELYDERSNLSIFGGKFCSLCDVKSSEDEEEENASSSSPTPPQSVTPTKRSEEKILEDDKVQTLLLDLNHNTDLLETSSILSLSTTSTVTHSSQMPPSEEPSKPKKGLGRQHRHRRSRKIAPARVSSELSFVTTSSKR